MGENTALCMHGLQASISETPVQRRRRLKVEAILPTDPGQDGIAIGLDGKVYSDTAITDAVARVGELGPLDPKVAVCHFPPQERAQFQVKAHGPACSCRVSSISSESVHSFEGTCLVTAQTLDGVHYRSPAVATGEVPGGGAHSGSAAGEEGRLPGTQIPKEEVCLRVHPVRPCVRLLHRG